MSLGYCIKPRYIPSDILMKGCAAAFPAIKGSKWAVFCSEQHGGNSNNAFKLWGIYWIQLWSTLIYLNTILKCNFKVLSVHFSLLLTSTALLFGGKYRLLSYRELVLKKNIVLQIRDPVKFRSPFDSFPICCY